MKTNTSMPTLRAALLAGFLAVPALSIAQADMPPVNDLPNPYTTQAGYFKMPGARAARLISISTGRVSGSQSAVAAT